MSNFIQQQKDWLHFTNKCCFCGKHHDDSAMVPIAIERNGHYEPDYACTLCAVKEKMKAVRP